MTPLLTVLAPILGDVIRKVIPDKTAAAAAEREVTLSLLDQAENLEKAQASIIKAEASSSSWLTSSWRPILMIVITAIVACNYLFFPIIEIVIPSKQLSIALPKELWNLLTVGVGGYIVGRSGEKIAKTWKNKE